jgi:probable HAF family extracellular repeat protein
MLLPGGGHRAFLWTDGTMQDLGTLGGTESIAYDVNADGEIVGASAVDLTEQCGFLWHRGQMRNLGTLGGTWSEATAISDAAQIVGASRTATDSDEHACRWSHGVLQDLGTLPGCLVSRANDINHVGQVVGYCLPSGPRSRTSPSRSRGGAFLYTDATGMVDLNTRIDPKSAWELDTATALNDAGQIVGNGRHRGRTRGFRLTPLIGR